MSAIVEMLIDRRRRYAKAALSRHTHAARTWERAFAAAGRAIVDASNAAGAGRAVAGAPRTWAVRWSHDEFTDAWYADRDGNGQVQIAGPCFAPGNGRGDDLCPTWLGGAWVWSSAAHDPRPCAWPRPFARGADR